MRTFSVEWMPDYQAWGVFVREGKRGICPAYYCNEPDSKEKAEAHAKRLEREYQPELPL